jgi:thioredoxin-like protein HI_1115
MKSINYKKLLKNAISLLLTFVIISSVLDFIRKPTVPDNINATALYDLQGNPFFLPQLAQDKSTLLYFWGTWCGYCRYTSPAINDLAKEGYPVVSVALRSGSTQEVADYLAEHQYSFTTVNDPRGELANQWEVGVTPTIIILHNGKMDLATTGWTSYWGLKVRLFLATFL